MVVSPELLDFVIGLVERYLKTFDEYPPGRLPFTADPDEDVVDSKRIEKTVPARFGIETPDVGMDLISPTSNDYDPPFEFTGGTIEKVTIELSPSSPEPDEEMGQQEFWDKIIQEVIR